MDSSVQRFTLMVQLEGSVGVSFGKLSQMVLSDGSLGLFAWTIPLDCSLGWFTWMNHLDGF